MLKWVCLQKHHTVYKLGEKLFCPRCREFYGLKGNIPVFINNKLSQTTGITGESGKIRDFWHQIKTTTIAGAVSDFGKSNRCSKNYKLTDWKFFINISGQAQILELGGGYGEDTIALARQAENVVSIVPTSTNAFILEQNLLHQKIRNVKIAVCETIKNLPLENNSISAIAIESDAFPGFKYKSGDLKSIASELKRIIKPSGTVFIGLTNPLEKIFGLPQLRFIIKSAISETSMNRFVKSVATSTVENYSKPGFSTVIKTMTKSGFSRPKIFIPLPDENNTEIVIPLEDPELIRYCFRHLLRRNSFYIRLMTVFVDILLKFNVFHYFVPYYFLQFKIEDDYLKNLTQPRHPGDI